MSGRRPLKIVAVAYIGLLQSDLRCRFFAVFRGVVNGWEASKEKGQLREAPSHAP